MAYLERTRRIAGKRLPIQLSYHYTSLAHLYLQRGRIDEAVDFYRAAVDLTRQARFVPGSRSGCWARSSSAWGRRAEALPHLQEAIGLFAQLKDRECEAAVAGPRVARALLHRWLECRGALGIDRADLPLGVCRLRGKFP